jgi:aspartyl-tRNA(Asn)/glutamyl-tRNA(Gln) amidotransferase subunit A
MVDWIDCPLSEIATALKGGSLSPIELSEQSIDCHNRWDPQFKAYKNWQPEKIREQARLADAAFKKGTHLGGLQGIPISVKDLYGVTGYPVFAGSPKQLPTEFEREGPVVKSIRDQLCLITGKTHTVEFAFGGLGTNPHWGTPRNPWDADDHRVPGGSSAGAGVSLLEGSALVALGTDTGGSVRIPASMTGNVGIKNTLGRWSTKGIVPLSTTFDTPGILAKSIADLVFAFESIESKFSKSGNPIVARDIDTIRIATTKDFFWDQAQDDIGNLVENAIAELSTAGAKTTNIDFQEAYEAVRAMAKGTIAASEGYQHLLTQLPDWIDTLDPNVASRMATGRDASVSDYKQALAQVKHLWEPASHLLSSVDVLAVPTIPITPPKVNEVADPASYSVKNMAALSNTMAANALNLCAVTVPIGLDKAGMPVGLQLIARANSEENLLSVALAFETILGKPQERLGKAPLGGTAPSNRL